MQPKTPSVTFEHDRGRSENGARCDAGHSLRGGAKGHFTHETDVTQLRFTPFVAFTRKASFCLGSTTFTDAIALEAIEVASDETFRSDLDTSKGKAYSAD